MVFNALFAVLALHVWQTVAPARDAVTCKPVGICPKRVAFTLMTLTVDCITKESGLAVLAVVSLSVINTLQTFSSVWVTVALVRLNPVL